MSDDAVAVARTHAAKSEWREVLDILSEVGPDELSPTDLDMAGEAHWWAGSPDDSLARFEQAVSAFERAGQKAEAAKVAAKLAYLGFRRQNLAVGNGWMARAQALLEGEPESEAHGWLQILAGVGTMLREKDWDAALGILADALQVARRVHEPGMEAMAKSFTGYALMQKGDPAAGLRLTDEATTLALSSGVDPRWTGDVYCNTIALCRDLGDFRRASEWTEEAERWMRTHSVGGYPGVCQVHRAELKRLHGNYSDAETEARKACVELEKFHILDSVGVAYYEIGEARRRMGDLDAAQEAFDKAYEYGSGAQPGRSLLLMDRGDIEGAARSISGSLDRMAARVGKSESPQLHRGRLLPAQVEIAIELGDLETAESAVEELEELARSFDALSWQATAATCRGSLELARGEPEHAIDLLSEAWRLWSEIGLPYEGARSRSLLGLARAKIGDEEGAELEFRAARSALSRIGAVRDVQRLNEVLGDQGTKSPASRPVMTFVFTDIVTSTDLIELIGDAAWDDLLSWHDRLIMETVGEAGGETVNHTGDGFLLAFDSPRKAIDCSVSVQRRLAQHRRDHGFAPEVRIGIHQTEATRRGGNYSGKGVHVASRITDQAGAGEIFISHETLSAAGTIPYEMTKAVELDLKGIEQAVSVESIRWDNS